MGLPISFQQFVNKNNLSKPQRTNKSEYKNIPLRSIGGLLWQVNADNVDIVRQNIQESEDKLSTIPFLHLQSLFFDTNFVLPRKATAKAHYLCIACY